MTVGLLTIMITIMYWHMEEAKRMTAIQRRQKTICISTQGLLFHQFQSEATHLTILPHGLIVYSQLAHCFRILRQDGMKLMLITHVCFMVLILIVYFTANLIKSIFVSHYLKTILCTHQMERFPSIVGIKTIPLKNGRKLVKTKGPPYPFCHPWIPWFLGLNTCLECKHFNHCQYCLISFLWVLIF